MQPAPDRPARPSRGRAWVAVLLLAAAALLAVPATSQIVPSEAAFANSARGKVVVGAGGGSRFTSIDSARGNDQTCAIDAAKAVWCWGPYDSSQWGATNPVPAKIPLALGANQISVGGSFACALTTAQTVWCWGRGAGAGSTLGLWGMPYTATPTAVSLAGVTTIDSGYGNACALTSLSAVWCWGDGWGGTLGNGTNTSSAAPVKLASGPTTYTYLGTGCAISAGRSYCWGSNNSGQVTGIVSSLVYRPTAMGPTSVTSVVASDSGHCVLTSAGVATCWGANRGNGLTTEGVGALVSGGRVFTKLSGGGDATCGKTAAGPVWCWGGNYGGKLGDGTQTNAAVPVLMSAMGTKTAATVALGLQVGCGLESTGQAWCWGFDFAVGTGLPEDYNSIYPAVSALVGWA